jgi:hypothetical protein
VPDAGLFYERHFTFLLLHLDWDQPDVGSGGFEPPKPKQQIYSLSHLATLETPLLLAMSHLSGSNQRPTDYKSVALPAELKWHVKELGFLTKILEFCKKDCKKSVFY